MTNTEALWISVTACPTDDTLKLALADAVRENGDSDLAATIHWCVERRRWPQIAGPSTPTWKWISGKTADPPRKQTAVLPSPLYTLVDSYLVGKFTLSRTKECYFYRGGHCRGRIESLCDVFVFLRELSPKWG